jgi:hypothetical protein
MGAPEIMTRPDFGFSRLKIAFIKVDFPAPFGPTTATISRASTRIDTPLRISTSRV